VSNPAGESATPQSTEATEVDLNTILFPTEAQPDPAAEAASDEAIEGELIEEEGAGAGHDPEFDDELGDEEENPAAGDGDEPDPEAAQDEAEGEETEADEAADATEELDEEDAKARAKFTPEQQKQFDKAMAKKSRKTAEIKAQLDEREQSLTQLQTELEEARANPPATAAPTPDNPLLDVADEAALEERLTIARKRRRWARANLNGALLDAEDGKQVEFTPEQVGEMLAEAEELIEEHVPARREFLRVRHTADQEAESAYPWLKNKATAGAVEIEKALRQYPQLGGLVPDVKLAMADMFIGRNMRLIKAQEAAKKADPKSKATGKLPGVRKAPASPAGGTRPARVHAQAIQKKTAAKRFTETGHDQDNAALLAVLNE